MVLTMLRNNGLRIIQFTYNISIFHKSENNSQWVLNHYKNI